MAHAIDPADATELPNEALATYRQALTTGQDTLGAILGTAAVFLDMGDNHKARTLLEAAVILLPIGQKDTRAAEVHGLLALACARLGQLDQARRAFANSIDEDNGDWLASNPEAAEANAKVWNFQ